MIPAEVSVYCPHCGKHTAVTPAPLSILRGTPGITGPFHAPVQEFRDNTPHYFNGSSWWLGKCNACREPLLVQDEGRTVFPLPQPGPVSEHIPEPMRSDLREAKLCLVAGAWNASAVMARRALQCAAVDQGAPKGEQLWQQIKWMDDNRKITSPQREWAEAARWVGNHGAHDTEPDVATGSPTITDVTQEDARDTITLVEHLFESLYVAPHHANDQLAKRGKSPRQ